MDHEPGAGCGHRQETRRAQWPRPRTQRRVNAASTIPLQQFVLKDVGGAAECSLQVFVEPGEGAAHAVHAIFLIVEGVAFTGVDDELAGNIECLQGVPELK